MPKLNKLSSVQVKTAPPGKYNDGGGLWLVKREDGLLGQWVLRYTIHGDRREMGLGSADLVSLKRAREKATSARELVAEGRDPISERQAEKRSLAGNRNLLRDVAKATFEAKQNELKGGGAAARWFSPLELHVLPKLGKMPVVEITQSDIATVLKPIWHTKAATAEKAINRLGICIKYAAAMGLDVDVQATTKAKALLGKQKAQVTHVPSLPWQELPEFYSSLEEPTITHLALRFLVLTAVRSGELRMMTFGEVSGGVWTIPAERMKSGVEHRVPLSEEAMRILKIAEPFSTERAVFPGIRGGPVSDATLSRFMERRGMIARPHGFRSSFRTWCAERTETPREIAETALAHVAGGKVELAYRRTDYLDQRRDLMNLWADYVTGSNAGEHT